MLYLHSFVLCNILQIIMYSTRKVSKYTRRLPEALLRCARPLSSYSRRIDERQLDRIAYLLTLRPSIINGYGFNIEATSSSVPYNHQYYKLIKQSFILTLQVVKRTIKI